MINHIATPQLIVLGCWSRFGDRTIGAMDWELLWGEWTEVIISVFL